MAPGLRLQRLLVGCEGLGAQPQLADALEILATSFRADVVNLAPGGAGCMQRHDSSHCTAGQEELELVFNGEPELALCIIGCIQ